MSDTVKIPTERLAAKVRVPIREGLLTGPLDELGEIRLAGSQCSSCGETSLGTRDVCPNCGRAAVHHVPLGNRGLLWSFTIIRHRPPGDYRGPDPFKPLAVGLVELPDGIRVFSPIQCGMEELRIGMTLRFKTYLRHDEGRDVVVFAFEPLARE